jgi:GDP-L-fucose synthase
MASFWKGKNVFVTGGGGFIGSHVVELLASHGAAVTVPIRPDRKDPPAALLMLLDRIRILRVPLEDETKLARRLEGVDAVLNLAARTGPSVLFSSQHHGTLAYRNIRPFISVLEASRLAGVGRFLICSSACVYPADAHTPMKEEEGFLRLPEASNEGYGMAKRFQEYLGMQYAREYGMHVTIARPFNAYGPRDYFDALSSHVIPALIWKALHATDTLDVWGSGAATRGFIYVEDVARGILSVAERAPVVEPINIGPHEMTSIRALATCIVRLCGRDLSLRFDHSKPEGQSRRSADVTRAETLLGFRPAVALEEGLRRTIDWFRHETQSFKTTAV